MREQIVHGFDVFGEQSHRACPSSLELTARRPPRRWP
jgi:hypothetical protein